MFSLLLLFNSQPPSKCHKYTQDWKISKEAEVNIISNASDQDDGSAVDWVKTGDVVGPRHHEKRSPICKRSPSPCIKKIKKKGKKVDLGYVSVRYKFPGKKITKKTAKLITKSAPLGKKLIGLTFGSPPLALILKKKNLKKAPKATTPIKGTAGTAPKLTKAGLKAVGPVPKLTKATIAGPQAVALAALGPLALGPLALGPLALGTKAAPAGAKLLKAGAAGPLLPVGKTAAKGLPVAVLLLSQNQGRDNQRSGSSRSGSSRNGKGGIPIGGCHIGGNGSSCSRKGRAHTSEEETTTGAPTEEEEASRETQAAIKEAQANINEAKAAMQQVLAAMRGS